MHNVIKYGRCGAGRRPRLSNLMNCSLLRSYFETHLSSPDSVLCFLRFSRRPGPGLIWSCPGLLRMRFEAPLGRLSQSERESPFRSSRNPKRKQLHGAASECFPRVSQSSRVITRSNSGPRVKTRFGDTTGGCSACRRWSDPLV